MVDRKLNAMPNHSGNQLSTLNSQPASSARFPVVTGLGIIAANGFGVDEVWNSLRAGKSGLKPLNLFQSPRYGQIPAGEIQNDLIALGAPSHGSRSDQLG